MLTVVEVHPAFLFLRQQKKNIMASIKAMNEIAAATPIPALAPVERPLLFCREFARIGEAVAAVSGIHDVDVPVGGIVFVMLEVKTAEPVDEVFGPCTTEGVIVIVGSFFEDVVAVAVRVV